MEASLPRATPTATPRAAVRVPPTAPVLLVALGLGWLFDAFFDGEPVGVSAPLFALLLVGALGLVGRAYGVRPAWRNAWVVAPLLFFATMLCVRANPLLSWANGAAVLVLLALLAYFYGADALDRLGLGGYPAVCMEAIGNGCTRPVPPLSDTVALLGSRGRGVPVRGVALGLVLAAPLLLVYALLMSSADAVFADYARRTLRLGFLVDLPSWSGHALVAATVGWVVAGGLLFAVERRSSGRLPDEALTGAGGLGFVESATVLALVDALFAAFVWVQLAYLFSPDAVWTLPYEAYRDYARQGFFELLVISALTMTVILGLRWLTRRATGRQELLFRVASTVLVGLTFVVLASALRRLVNWEQAEFYVNTQVRIYVRWFTIWQGIAFLWLVAVLWRWPNRFAIGGFVCALGFLATVNLLDPDADVAAYNLARGDELSTRFVRQLSDDAVPTLAAGLATAPEPVRAPLRQELAGRLAALEAEDDRPWPSFHFAHWRARRSLEALKATGELG